MDLPAPSRRAARCPTDAATHRAGRLIAGRYGLRSVLGRGGMGQVWLAWDELLDRPVALKQVILHDPAPEQFRQAALLRALGEARAAARVRHDGVVRIHDVVKQDGRPWIVMELLPGRTLAQTLDAQGPLSVSEATRVGLRLLDVLRATHRAGVVHGDVKPANVQLCPDGRVVLTDFGVARAAGDETSVPDHLFAGSPAYASPEQFRGRRPGPASDLFSLGATLFTAVEGRPPFDRGDLIATLIAVAEDAPPPLLRAGPIRPVLEGLLAKEPHRRPTADQAHEALSAIERGRSATDHDRHTDPAVRPGSEPRRQLRPHRILHRRSPASASGQAVTGRAGEGAAHLVPGGDAELGEHVSQVVFDGAGTQEQPCADLGIG
jgi:serine/threonine protein kinase